MVLFSWNFFRNAPRYVSQYGTPDVIVASSPHPYSFLAAHAVARKFGAKVFFEVRDLWPLSLIELAGVSPTHPLITITASLEKFAYKRADCVVSLLPLTKPHMLQRGLSDDRWAYIPNGIDLQEKRSSEEEGPISLLAKRWKTEGGVVFVYAGALGRPNHVDSLLRATAILKLKGDKKVKILIVGKGEAEADLRRLRSELNLDADVQMFGQVPKNQVVEIFGEVDAGYISLRPEPIFRFGISPNKLFDYMLAALPVVFAVSAGNDPVEEANCGFSAPAGDVEAVAIAMQKVVGLSVTQRREMGERGRAYVLERHDYSSLAASYLALINR
jgi:glycosyltransferase involved in cell wall biosynthesis